MADSVWDYAPDFANDSIPPYPSLKYPDGTNISVANLRGTRLYGFKGCGNNEANAITEAYNDFYKLAQQESVYKNIDWNSKAAVEFWGPASGPNLIPDNTRAEILQIFQAAQQIYSQPWQWYPPWEWYLSLWIEVRCSDGTLGPTSTDPDNFCGDAKPNPGNCPDGSPRSTRVTYYTKVRRGMPIIMPSLPWPTMSNPSPGRKKPLAAPREASQSVDQLPGEEQDPPDDMAYPGCPDKVGLDVAADAIHASLSSRYDTTTTWATPLPSMDPVACFCTYSGVMSSWCLPGPGDYAPSGWTQIPGHVTYCTGLPALATPDLFPVTGLLRPSPANRR